MVNAELYKFMMMKVVFDLLQRKALKRRFRRAHTIAQLENIIWKIIEENMENLILLEEISMKKEVE